MQAKILQKRLTDAGHAVRWAENGALALEMARESYALNLSQQQYSPRVLDSGPYDCSRFGLVRSEVGSDVRKDDFFENIVLAGG